MLPVDVSSCSSRYGLPPDSTTARSSSAGASSSVPSVARMMASTRPARQRRELEAHGAARRRGPSSVGARADRAAPSTTSRMGASPSSPPRSAEQLERRVVGLLQVLGDDDERPLARVLLEEAAEHGARELGALLGLADERLRRAGSPPSRSRGSRPAATRPRRRADRRTRAGARRGTRPAPRAASGAPSSWKRSRSSAASSARGAGGLARRRRAARAVARTSRSAGVGLGARATRRRDGVLPKPSAPTTVTICGASKRTARVERRVERRELRLASEEPAPAPTSRAWTLLTGPRSRRPILSAASSRVGAPTCR